MSGCQRKRVRPCEMTAFIFGSTHRNDPIRSMAVFCAKCGEELLGAINRCWRCGTEYESRSGRVDVPPIRRAPIRVPLFGTLEAEVVDVANAVNEAPSGPASDDGMTVQGLPSSQVEASNQGQPNGQVERAGAAATPWPRMRCGSPFRTKESALAEGQPGTEFPATDKPLATVYPKHGGASAGSIIAITLGLLGLGMSNSIPPASMLIACLGLGIGIWGLYSPRRRAAAILGLLLCCLAVALAGFFCSVELYRAIHGVTPWESAP